MADLFAPLDRRPVAGQMDSPWQSGDYSRDSVLFPSELLEATRSEPIASSSSARLSHLWSISSSHGMSWDELDDQFLAFHREYLQAEQDWFNSLDTRWDAEYRKSEELLKASLKGDDAQIALTLNRRRGKIRRMTYTRLARMRNKEIIKKCSLPNFINHMREFATRRVAKREQSERGI